MTNRNTEWTREINDFLSKMQNVIDVLVPKIEPFVQGLIDFARVDKIRSEVASSGWLPHHTTPLDTVADCGGDVESIQRRLQEYYEQNWPSVRRAIESQMSQYDIDQEATATFREVLDAHEHGFFRCVPRTLFPEIDRLLRMHVLGTNVGIGTSKKTIKNLVENRSKGLSDFLPGGWVNLESFHRLTEGLAEADATEVDGGAFGIFRSVFTDDAIERVKSDPVPNRNAAIHGLVAYPSSQNSLNAIFFADYIFQLVSSLNSGQPDGNEDPKSSV